MNLEEAFSSGNAQCRADKLFDADLLQAEPREDCTCSSTSSSSICSWCSKTKAHYNLRNCIMPHKNKNNPAHIQWSFLHTFGPSWKLNIGSQMCEPSRCTAFRKIRIEKKYFEWRIMDRFVFQALLPTNPAHFIQSWTQMSTRCDLGLNYWIF